MKENTFCRYFFLSQCNIGPEEKSQADRHLHCLQMSNRPFREPLFSWNEIPAPTIVFLVSIIYNKNSLLVARYEEVLTRNLQTNNSQSVYRKSLFSKRNTYLIRVFSPFHFSFFLSLATNQRTAYTKRGRIIGLMQASLENEIPVWQ